MKTVYIDWTNILRISSKDTFETRRIAQRMKAVGFFRKPVDGMALLDAIEWAMWSNKNDNDQRRE